MNGVVMTTIDYQVSVLFFLNSLRETVENNWFKKNDLSTLC